MTERIKAVHLNPDDFECKHCHVRLEASTPITKRGYVLKIGHLMVCYHCGGVNILKANGLDKLSKPELKKLHPKTQQALRVIREKIQKQMVAGKIAIPQREDLN